MRKVALLLVLTLAGPAVASAVCEVACAQAAHHQSHAGARGCHEEGPAGDGVVLSGATTAPCHGQHEDSIAVVTASKVWLYPAAVPIEPLISPGGDMRMAPSGSTVVRLPDRLPIQTLLRI